MRTIPMRRRRTPRRAWYRCSNQAESRLVYLGHLLIENRHGLIADAMATIADGFAERAAQLLTFVRRRPVDRRHRNVVQSQIYAQLAAVMDDVVQNEIAEHGDARHREDLLTAALQRPRRRVLGVCLVHHRPRLSG